jgi:hypothetical protein
MVCYYTTLQHWPRLQAIKPTQNPAVPGPHANGCVGKTVFQAADNLRRLHAARLSRTCGYSLRCMLGTCGVNPIVFEFTCGLQRFGKVRCSAAKGLRLVSTRGVVGGAHLVTTHHCSACQACTASHNMPGGMQDLAVARVVLYPLESRCSLLLAQSRLFARQSKMRSFFYHGTLHERERAVEH